MKLLKSYLSRTAWFAYEKTHIPFVPLTFHPSVMAPEVAPLKPGHPLNRIRNILMWMIKRLDRISSGPGLKQTRSECKPSPYYQLALLPWAMLLHVVTSSAKMKIKWCPLRETVLRIEVIHYKVLCTYYY